jgi:hypothetical protein
MAAPGIRATVRVILSLTRCIFSRQEKLTKAVGVAVAVAAVVGADRAAAV